MKATVYSKNRRTVSQQLETMQRFTEAYIAHTGGSLALREAACLAAQFPHMLCDIEADDFFAGRVLYLPICFTPQHTEGETGYCCIEQGLQLLKQEATPQQCHELDSLQNFWQSHKTVKNIEAHYDDEMKHYMPHDDFTKHTGIAFPMYRIAGVQVDYTPILRYGITGFRAMLIQKQAERQSEKDLLTAMISCMDTLEHCCRYYMQQASESGFTAIAQTLAALLKAPPATLRQAIQLVHLYWILSGAFNLGRMDCYLSRLYTADIDSGRLTEEEALELLCEYWRLLDARDRMYDIRITIGGRGRPNEAAADRFALAAIEATRRVKEITPQLTLRFYSGMNPRLMESAWQCIGEGRTYPMLYNDDVNIPAAALAMGVSEQDAQHYTPLGCGEYMLFNKSVATPSGAINLLKALEATLNNGRDLLTDEIVGLEQGYLRDYTTFEELWTAYTKQVEHFVAILARQQRMEYDGCAQDFECLYYSMLYDCCLERNRSILSGGCYHLGGTLESYGNTNTSDSLTAIKQLVYDSREVTGEQLLQALKENHASDERLRALLLNASKYGNDDSYADAMAQRVHEHLCLFTRERAGKVGLDSYLVVLINNKANSDMGVHTGASADGRLARTFMANANNPTGSMDKRGITSMLNSLTKLNPAVHAGTVQNIKLSPALFRGDKLVLRALFNAYFENGGTQAMVTVLDRQDLENALRYPERYPNLMVRVGGFSARYVTLAPEVQREILSRTLYE